MSMSSDGSATRTHPPAPNTTLVAVNPADPVSVDMVKIGPGGTVLAPVLVLPGGVRVYIDALSTDIDAAEWWKDLGCATRRCFIRMEVRYRPLSRRRSGGVKLEAA